jgi:spore coat protein CotH
MTRVLAALPLVFAGFAALPAAEVAPPPRLITDRDALFRKPQVLKIAIDVGKKEVEALGREPRKYVKCTFKEGDTELKDVGVHLKGAAGSWRDFNDKPGLTLNADKYVDAQRFRGLDKFHLSNSVQDPSYLSELLCGELYRACGVPASRVTHALVTLNGRPRGLYYLKEGYDRVFLKAHFGGTGHGNFYDGGFLRDIDQDLQLVSGEGDVADRADLKALLTAAREGDEKKRFEKLEKLLDVDRFVSYLVLQAVTWDWDGYPMNRNNYRIYHDPKANKITFIPSGMDQMFGDPNGPILPGFNGFVAAQFVNTKEGKKRYYARLREVRDKHFNPITLSARLDEYEAVVTPALASVDANAGRDHKHHVNRLRDAIKQRAKSIDEQLKRVPVEK